MVLFKAKQIGDVHPMLYIATHSACMKWKKEAELYIQLYVAYDKPLYTEAIDFILQLQALMEQNKFDDTAQVHKMQQSMNVHALALVHYSGYTAHLN